MKKILFILMIPLLFILMGCNKLNNTPINKVEELLNKYQTLDESVIKELNNSLTNTTYTEEQKEKYKDIMKEQYRNMVYEIKGDKIDADKAVVTVEIKVLDYYRVLNDANTYYIDHREEFLENGSYVKKFNDYKLEKLKDAKEKVTYTIDFNLTKKDGKWNIDALSNSTLDKINGIYAY